MIMNVAEIIPLEDKSLPDNCFVFKHSTRCPISTAAAAFVRQASFGMPLYWVNVVEQRELSKWIAEQYQVRHESPQLLRIEGGAVAGNWTHSAIARDAKLS
jgi:bacillithiol system protein YtxJ